eukprot:jgi/Botrbrau1/14327/Bobra.0287s0019.1
MGDCKLLEGPAAASAQLLLALAAVAALLIKRQKEKPQRPMRVWGFDVTKQIVSSGAAHICGIIIAIIVAKEEKSNVVSQCAWYFVAYCFDTTIGVATAIALHWTVVTACRRKKQMGAPSNIYSVLADCGNYGNPPRWGRFALQLVEWTVCVILARVVCGGLVVGGQGVLVRVAAVLDQGFRGHPVALLFFVMIMCPLFMNLFQALVQDAVLKMRGMHSSEAAGKAAHHLPADQATLLETVERS